MKTNIRGKVEKNSQVVKEEELTPKQRLLRRILALRDSIEVDKGILSESYPLIREDRER
jgi:hypothetical protein